MLPDVKQEAITAKVNETGVTMKKMMDIFKKLLMGCIISLSACLLTVNDVSAQLAQCTTTYKNRVSAEHAKSAESDPCAVNRCATGASSGTVQKLQNASKGSCLNLMPIDNVSTLNISAVVGVRTDTTALGGGSKKATNSDGTRQHEGMDVGTQGQQNVKIYAPAQFYKAEVNAPLRGTMNGNIMTCSGGVSRITLHHKSAQKSKQKNCSEYTTVFLHVVNPRIGSVVKDVGKDTWIADAGGCSGYAIHMHYEIHDCDGNLYNPTCTSGGAGDPQQLCNGAENILPPAQDEGSTAINPNLSKMQDCSKEADKAECEKRNAAIKSGGIYCKPTDGSKRDSDKQCSLKKWKDNNGHVGAIPSDIEQVLQRVSQETGVPLLVLAGMVAQESSFNPKAKAHDGGQGAIQFQPSTWAAYTAKGNESFDVYEPSCQTRKSVSDCHPFKGKHTGDRTQDQFVTVKAQNGKCSGSVFNAYDNIKCGAIMYLDSLSTAKGNQNCAIKAHNTGSTSGNCDSNGYVQKINTHMKSLASLNDCSLNAVGLGGNCEDFRFDAYSTALNYGDSGGGVDWNSEHQCNIAENYSSIQGCLFCNLFRVVFDTASVAARGCHNLFSKSMVTLLAIGLAIVIAMTILRYVSAWKVVEPALLINELLQKIFIVAFIIVLLKLDVTEFFNMFVTPVFTAGFKMASLIINDTTTCDTGITGTVNGIGLPEEMGNSMLCAIYTIQARLEKMMALGSNSICIAVWIRSYWHIPIFPHMGYFITGIFLWLTAVVFMIAYPFLLIDSVLQFGIASSLFPVALASSAFKMTSRYLNIWKIVNIFASAMFNFIFLTTILFILLKGMDTQVIKPIIERAYNNAGTNGFFNLEVLAWFMKDFVLLIFFLFLGKAVLEDVPNFADDYAKAISLGEKGGKSNLGIGRKVGGTALSGATNIGKWAGEKTWEGTKVVGGGAIRGATNVVVSGARSARHNWLVGRTQRKMEKARSAAAAAGEEFNPETFVATGRTLFGRKVQRHLIQNADGSMALESKKKSLLRGRDIITVEDENVSIRTKVYKDGTRKDQIDIKNPYMKRLINRDGTRNQHAMNDILQNSNLPPEIVKKAILNQMMKERFSGMGKKFSWRAGWPPLIVSDEGSLDSGRYRSENIKSYTDKSGHEVFEIRRTDRAGITSVYKWTKGETRDLIEYERIQKNGKSTKWSSDGLLQKKEKGEYNLNNDGTFKNDINTIINGTEMRGLKTSADGKLLDKNGNAVGQVLKSGAVVDLHPEIIGTIEEQGWGMYGNVIINGAKLDNFYQKSEDPNGIYDKDFNLIGHVREDGNIVDANNQVVGTAEKGQLRAGNSTLRINGAEISDWKQKDGLIFDKDNQIIGQIMENGNIAKVTGQIQNSDLVFDSNGQVLGKRTINDMVVDQDGNVAGFINGDGAIINSQGQLAGLISEEEQKIFEKRYNRSSVEFSHSRAYKGATIFDEDGRRVHGMEDEELMFNNDDISLYQLQMKRYGDVLNHHRFGR